MDNRVVLLIGVVVVAVTDLTAEAGSRVGAHADIDVAGIKPVFWQLKLTIILVDFNVTLSGQQSLETTRAGQTGRRGALRGGDTRSTAWRRRLKNSLGTRLAGRRVPNVGKVVKSPLGPLDKHARVLHINYDLGALGFTGKAITLVQFPSAALAMQLEAIPAIADNLNLVGLERTCGRNETSLDVNTRYKAIGRDLVVGRVGGSAHNQRLAVFRQFDGGDGSERGSLGSGSGPLRRGTRQDTCARRGNGSRILEMSTRSNSPGA